MKALLMETGLRSGLDTLGLLLSDTQIGQLLRFQELLEKWNKVYNLTAVRDPAEMLTHHLLDSLAAVLPLQRERAGRASQAGADRLLDVGSGGGLPGVVFAICLPDLQIDCVDTVGKKVAFIQQAAGALRLPNLRGVHARVETITQPYDWISSRAFASLHDFTAWSREALRPGGTWVALKARDTDAEIAALPSDIDVFHVEPLQVPGLDAERCIVWMRRVGDGQPA